MALVAETIGAAALSLSALPFLAAGGAMLGTIATYARLTMGIAGGFNVLGGDSLLKGGLKLTQNNSKILTGITNTIDSAVAKTVSTAKDIGRRAVSTLKTGVTNVYKGTKNIANRINGVINPAKLAKISQGSGKYPGVDDWVNIRLKKGTKIWGGTPGQSNFYTSEEVMNIVGNDATKLNNGLQISKKGFTHYREGMTEYVLKKSIKVGYSRALANTQYGIGGYEQYFVANYKKYLEPIRSIIMTNR